MNVSTSTQVSSSAVVTFHTPSNELEAVSGPAEELAAFESLALLNLADDLRLSRGIDRTLAITQNAFTQLTRNFQGLSTTNDDLRRQVVAITSQLTQAANVHQVREEAFENQIDALRRQVAAAEQERADMLRQCNEDIAAATHREREAIQLANQAHHAQVEALNSEHTSAIQTLRDANTSLQSQLTQTTNDYQASRVTYDTISIQKDIEIQRITAELQQTQSTLQQTQGRLHSVSAALAPYQAAEQQAAARRVVMTKFRKGFQ